LPTANAPRANKYKERGDVVHGVGRKKRGAKVEEAGKESRAGRLSQP
jgi:hypothetical protein